MRIFTQQWRCASFILSKQIVEDKQEKERTIVERLKSLKKLKKLWFFIQTKNTEHFQIVQTTLFLHERFR